MFNLRSTFNACCAHKGETGTDQPAQVGRTERWSLTLQYPGIDPLAIGLAGIACHHAFLKSVQCHMVVRWKACETVAVGDGA